MSMPGINGQFINNMNGAVQPDPEALEKFKPENLENRFNDISNKLKNNPNDEGAKNDILNLKKDVQDEIQRQEAGGGDPKLLERLEKVLENIQGISLRKE